MIETLRNMLQFDNWLLSWPDIGVLIGYFILMLIVGFVCRKISANISDYIRMGCKGTWWLAGLSVFMQSFSAATFTGYCGQAFLAGWSVLLVFWGNALMFFIQGAFFAPWLRQTRAITPADAVRQRFGPVVEQFFVYLGIPGGLCWSGMFLLTLATFFAAMFGLPIRPTMVIMAIVIIFYSVSGGSWSVQITDTLQSFILMPVTIAIAGLCLVQLGQGDGMFAGAGNMLEMIKAKGLTDDFQIIKPANFEYPKYIGKSIGTGYFTVAWVLANVFNLIMTSANMTTCYRYLSIKDGRDARKAAFLAGTLMIVGSLIWFIPPVTGRLLYEKEILALGGDSAPAAVSAEAAPSAEADATVAAAPAAPAAPADAAQAKREALARREQPALKRKLDAPADGAYAYIARKVLPPGMLGLVLIAMTSAAMSSMDSNLTGTAGLLTNNLYPPLARLFGARPLTGRPLLTLTQVINFLLGCWALFMAFVFLKLSGKGGIFGMMLSIAAFIGAPVGTPMVVSFFVKRIPSWAPLVGMVCGYLSSTVLMIGPMESLWGMPKDVWFSKPPWHVVIFIQAGVTVIPTLLMGVFWSKTSEGYRRQVDEFFVKFHTPVDFAKEVGREADASQQKLVGLFAIVIGALLGILVIFGENFAEKMAALFVSLCVLGIGLLLYFSGIARERSQELLAEVLDPEHYAQTHPAPEDDAPDASDEKS